MKTILTILFTAVTSLVYSSNYDEVMKTNIDKMYTLKTQNELNDLANQFTRISNVEKDKWMPGYYAAYCYTRATVIGEIEDEVKQKQLDLAQAELDNVLKTTSGESEVYALQALIYQLRITGASTGYKYSKLSNEALTVAEKLDATNPRVYYLKGSNTFHTPKMFGGGKKKAKPLLEKASGLFESQKPKSELAPLWGPSHCAELLQQCKAD